MATLNNVCKCIPLSAALPAKSFHNSRLPLLSEVCPAPVLHLHLGGRGHGMNNTIPWNQHHQYHLHIEPASPSPEPEAIVPRVSAGLAQVPGLQLALLHSLLGPQLASWADTGNSSDRYISPATSWSRQPHPAHLYVGQSAGLAHHTQEPSHSAGGNKDIVEYRDT